MSFLCKERTKEIPIKRHGCTPMPFWLKFFWFFSGYSGLGNGAGMLAAGRSRKEGGRSHTVCMARPSDAADAARQQNRTAPGIRLRCTLIRKER